MARYFFPLFRASSNPLFKTRFSLPWPSIQDAFKHLVDLKDFNKSLRSILRRFEDRRKRLKKYFRPKNSSYISVENSLIVYINTVPYLITQLSALNPFRDNEIEVSLSYFLLQLFHSFTTKHLTQFYKNTSLLNGICKKTAPLQVQ